MCGICGFLSPSDFLPDGGVVLERMTQTLKHRGPDDSGVWLEEGNRVGLGHRRLAVIDLSKEGKQPMLSTCHRFRLVFNGEIYNFQSLRKELECLGVVFRGHSDTEVLLASISQWGIHKSLDRLNGMFALALWDCQNKILYLARDRIGEKPLYYGQVGKTFCFGSELKALRAHPDFKTAIDHEALTFYLRHSYVPSPHSIYRGIFKLPPGHLLSVPLNHSVTLKPVPYWSACHVIESGISNPFEGSQEEASSHLEALLKDAVRMRMISDVPLGAFLSGGIDSSTIVALMQAQNNSPVKTFSVGFYEKEYDEAEQAKCVAKHLGTDHTELRISPQQAISTIQKLPALLDEPLSDPSQIPTFLISQLARQKVTVALSGDGGDELFGGYPRYWIGPALWRKINWLPKPLRQRISKLLKSFTPARWEMLAVIFYPLFKRYGARGILGYKFHSLADLLSSTHPDQLYARFLCAWSDPNEILLNHNGRLSIHKPDASHLSNFTQRMMFYDLVGYLAEGILTKVDRATMGMSLEVRIPLLDHRIIEFAWRLPLAMKINGGEGKLILKKILHQYVPKELVTRPKMGFSFPVSAWLRGPLKNWAEDLLDEKRLRKEGFFNPEPIQKKWKEHLCGKRNWETCLWNILMFQVWRNQHLN